jgi:fatty-acyl-CoA synthase
MVKGLMQAVPLTIDLILRRAMTVGRDMEVVSVEPAGIDRRTWAEIGERVHRLVGALDQLGVESGTPVGSFAWNGHRHLELYYAVPCSGRVLHAVNVRLHPDDISYVVNHAGDTVMFVDASLTAILAPVRERLGVGQFVVMEDGAAAHESFAGDPRYEALLAASDPADLGSPAEDDAASICFTSGTTGRPKAVVYSHRSVVLHAMGELMADAHAVRRGDVVLPLTPMFHVNCWGLPYSSGLAPASLVFAGSDTSPPAVAALIESEQANVVAGIPTFWVQMDGVFAAGDHDLSSVDRILCGGAEAPPTLIRQYTDRGIDFMHAWGMTEMSPSGTANWVSARTVEVEGGARQGVAVPGVELRLVGDDGTVLPWDGKAVGELQARGPWIAAAYYQPEDESNTERFSDGWLRTGDVARIDPDGTVEIVDRTKDLVKSGGEWISSLELERALAAHPSVLEAAVIAIRHQRWGERPAALIVLRPNQPADAEDILRSLGEMVASWWIPDVVEFVDQLPKTGVGKIDKKRLRAEYAERLAAEL